MSSRGGRQRIKDLESELELVKAAAALSNGEEVQHPRDSGQSPWGRPSWRTPIRDAGISWESSPCRKLGAGNLTILLSGLDPNGTLVSTVRLTGGEVYPDDDASRSGALLR